MKRYEIHLHTNHSKCSGNKPEKILKTAKKRGLNGIAVTDHDSISGALEVKKLNKDKRFEVIIGEEVSTEIGHVLVYYVKKEIKRGKVRDVLKEARRQKAVCCLAHPYNPFVARIAKLIGYKNSRKTLTKENEKLVRLFDGIEVFNARNLFAKQNRMAEALAKKYKKTAIVGSDAHFSSEIGTSYVEFDDKYSLRQAILKNKIKKTAKKRCFFLQTLNRMRSVTRKGMLHLFSRK
jgi:predicted metal-dependent phosphoesterase TrpH